MGLRNMSSGLQKGKRNNNNTATAKTALTVAGNNQNKDLLNQTNKSEENSLSSESHGELEDLLLENDNQNKTKRRSIEILNNSISFSISFDLDFLKSFPDNMLYEAHCAQKGNQEAQVSLGIAYDKGTRGLTANTAEAVRWYALAADRDSLDAQMALAELYATGHQGRFEGSDALAFKYYKLAADNGHPEAQFKAATMILSEPSKLHDVPEALRYLKQSVKQGYTKALACCGTIMLQGKFVEMDIRRGVKFLKQAASQSDYVALHNLAFAFRLGLGVFQDRDQSRAYAELASFANRGKYDNDLEITPGMINYI
jgi:hypothetical protein